MPKKSTEEVHGEYAQMAIDYYDAIEAIKQKNLASFISNKPPMYAIYIFWRAIQDTEHLTTEALADVQITRLQQEKGTFFTFHENKPDRYLRVFVPSATTTDPKVVLEIVKATPSLIIMSNGTDFSCAMTTEGVQLVGGWLAIKAGIPLPGAPSK